MMIVGMASMPYLKADCWLLSMFTLPIFAAPAYSDASWQDIIHRFGAKDVEKGLPKMIQAVRETGQQVLWICDPMHGNTETSSGGLKTRRFENILKELELSFQIHEANGSFLGGVHIELTGEDVTECTGGARGLTDADLARAYKSTVDPRLNYEQALELAMLIGKHGPAR